ERIRAESAVWRGKGDEGERQTILHNWRKCLGVNKRFFRRHTPDGISAPHRHETGEPARRALARLARLPLPSLRTQMRRCGTGAQASQLLDAARQVSILKTYVTRIGSKRRPIPLGREDHGLSKR